MTDKFNDSENFRVNLQQNAALECGQHYYHYVGMMMAPLVIVPGGSIKT